jgi:hypothetical protein
MIQMKLTDHRRKALRLALLSGWAEQMFMTILDVAAIELDSLPQRHRLPVDAARDVVERFMELQSVLETDPDLWKALLCDEYDREKEVTEPLALLVAAQFEAEDRRGKGRARMSKEINPSSPKPPRAPTRARPV